MIDTAKDDEKKSPPSDTSAEDPITLLEDAIKQSYPYLRLTHLAALAQQSTGEDASDSLSVTLSNTDLLRGS